MLDRRDAGLDRALDRLGAVRVRGDLASPHRGFVDDGVHLLLRVLRRADGFLLGEHAGGRDHLDDVGAVLHLEADELADLVDAVGDAGERVELEVGREAAQVVVAAGRTDGERRRLHARTGDVAAVDRVSQRDVDELARSRRRGWW